MLRSITCVYNVSILFNRWSSLTQNSPSWIKLIICTRKWREITYEWRTFRHYGKSLNDAVFWSVMRQKRHTDPFRVHLDNAVSQSSSQQKCNFAFWGVSSHELISKWVVQTSIFFLPCKIFIQKYYSSQNSVWDVTKSFRHFHYKYLSIFTILPLWIVRRL